MCLAHCRVSKEASRDRVDKGRGKVICGEVREVWVRSYKEKHRKMSTFEGLNEMNYPGRYAC